MALGHMDQGLVMVDGVGSIRLANDRAIALLDLPRVLMISGPTYPAVLEVQWRSGEYGRNGERVDARVREMIRAAAAGRDLFGDLTLYERTRPNGTVLEIRTSPLPTGGFVRTYTDVTERKQTEALMTHLARHDHLTGLANRRYFQEQIDAAIAAAGLDGCSALLFLDLDRFKSINDTFGHAAGDAVIETVGRRLRSVSPAGTSVGRLGGDEFAVLCAETRTATIATALADQIIDLVCEPIVVDDRELTVGVSIGIAFAPKDATDSRGLQRKADLALFRAKTSGRNRRCVFDETIDVGC
ncbi:diguanylate cyclase domain-containing protein [Rhodoplanes sp. SY1]|uniref:diguanylate cyclase domain-containing protein n=1 Tax=Rhodoplanes sp. SY1 TaxID=3166646 RepID=UPI0038B561B8